MTDQTASNKIADFINDPQNKESPNRQALADVLVTKAAEYNPEIKEMLKKQNDYELTRILYPEDMAKHVKEEDKASVQDTLEKRSHEIKTNTDQLNQAYSDFEKHCFTDPENKKYEYFIDAAKQNNFTEFLKDSGLAYQSQFLRDIEGKATSYVSPIGFLENRFVKKIRQIDPSLYEDYSKIATNLPPVYPINPIKDDSITRPSPTSPEILDLKDKITNQEIPVPFLKTETDLKLRTAAIELLYDAEIEKIDHRIKEFENKFFATEEGKKFQEYFNDARHGDFKAFLANRDSAHGAPKEEPAATENTSKASEKAKDSSKASEEVGEAKNVGAEGEGAAKNIFAEGLKTTRGKWVAGGAVAAAVTGGWALHAANSKHAEQESSPSR